MGTAGNFCLLQFPLKLLDGGDSFAHIWFVAEQIPKTSTLYAYRTVTSTQEDSRPKHRIEGTVYIDEYVQRDESPLDDGLGHIVYDAGGPVYTKDNSAMAGDGMLDSCVPEPLDCPFTINNGAETLEACGYYYSAIRHVDLYSLKTRNLLLSILGEDGDPTVNVRGHKVQITGLGCDESVELPQE